MAQQTVIWKTLNGKVVPQVVVDAMARKFGQDTPEFVEKMGDLEWDGLNGCFYFWHANMYHGVEEKDGHIHT